MPSIAAGAWSCVALIGNMLAFGSGPTITWMKYRPELDGIRGIAVALVVLAHAGVPGFRWGGQVGVTLFFVLSGYLITRLLASEFGERGRISLGDFYWRRARRLFPGLAVLLVASLVVGWVTVRDAAAISLYVGNWVRADGGSLGYLGHTWSLAIEEQFYLLWPVAFVAGLRSPRLLLGLALGSAISRFVVGGDWGQFASFARADGLLVGCALGLRPVAASRWTLAAGLIGLSLATAIAWPRETLYSWLIPLSIAGSALTIAGATSGVLSARPFVYLGKISYALYLWHVPLLATDLPTGTAVLLSIILAALSTALVERPFRHMPRPAALRPSNAPPATAPVETGGER